MVDSIVDSSINQFEFGNIMVICRALLQYFPNFSKGVEMQNKSENLSKKVKIVVFFDKFSDFI